MAARIQYVDPVLAPLQRRPRIKASGHLEAIRALPCLICHRAPSEAAHIRTVARKYGKRETGTAEKPSDVFVLPLCAEHHRTGPDAQHRGNELEFYRRQGINPFVTALALWAASGRHEDMVNIVMEARDG